MRISIVGDAALAGFAERNGTGKANTTANIHQGQGVREAWGVWRIEASMYRCTAAVACRALWQALAV